MNQLETMVSGGRHGACAALQRRSRPSTAAIPRFATTHWSVVLMAGRNDDSRSHQALAGFCQSYWYPLYAFVRRHGYTPQDAQDLTQGFFEHLLEHGALARVDRTRGKFRCFLLASLRHFLSNAWDRVHAQKRGGECVLVPLDLAFAESRYELEPADNSSPDKVFERNWALALLEKTFARLSAEQAAVGKAAQFERLRDYLSGGPGAPRCPDLALRLGLSAEAIRAAVSRLRRRYGELLREEIARTINDPGEIEEEIRHLFLVLGGK
jgi:DNA-directed RNA polymerase specialized sigma24 family protein